MNIFLIFGALIWAGILGVIFLSLIVLLIVAGARKSWKLALWSMGGTIGAMTAVTGVFLLSGYLLYRPYDPTSETELNEAYRADFGALPPLGITVLKARQVIIGDAGCQWLLLKATPEEIQNHISKGFTSTQYIPPDFNGGAGPNAPAWWIPTPSRLNIYENKNWSKAGGWYVSEATMGIDRSSGLIWFFASKHG